MSIVLYLFDLDAIRAISTDNTVTKCLIPCDQRKPSKPIYKKEVNKLRASKIAFCISIYKYFCY